MWSELDKKILNKSDSLPVGGSLEVDGKKNIMTLLFLLWV